MGMPPDWECVGMSEIDKYANMVLKYRYRDVKNYGNIEKINYEELPDFDIQIGGSPCQDISVAGKRAGLAGLRSRLFFSYVALLKVKQPDYFIFENVKGLLSSNEGRDFAEVINQFSEAGYDIWWQVLDATDFGIPQHRERIFILGTLGGSGFRKVFLKRKDKEKDIELQRQQANTITRRYKQSQANGSYIVERKFNAQIENLHFDRSQQNRIYGINGVAPTLHRHTGGGQVTKIGIPVSDVGHGNARQNGRRMKFPDEPSFTLQSAQRQGVAFESSNVSDVNLDDSKNKIKPIGKISEYHNSLVYDPDGISPTLTLQGGNHKPRITKDGTWNIRNIRYLTPLECERLMGWPDNWTKYGIDGKGDIVELSDNARYNLIGNGVVPQVVREIVRHIMNITMKP